MLSPATLRFPCDNLRRRGGAGNTLAKPAGMSDILNPIQVGAVLGLHPETVKEHLRAGRLPGRKVGRQWRVPRAALDTFLAAQEAPAPPERPRRSDVSAGAVLDLVQALRSAVELDPAPHRTSEALRELRFAVRILQSVQEDLAREEDAAP